MIPCRACFENYIDPPVFVVKGFCEDHKGYKVKPRCIKCIELKVEKPKPANKDKLCIQHCRETGIEPKIKFCTICLEENPENPNQVFNNGLCFIHGAKKKECFKCIEEKCEPIRIVQKNDLCQYHLNNVEYDCLRCIQYKLENPNKVKQKNKLCEIHKGTRSPCLLCIEEGIFPPRNAEKEGLCYTHHEVGRKICTECEKEGKNTLARRDGLCSLHDAKNKRCSKCGLKDAKTGGLCRSCGGKETAKYCEKDGCNLISVRKNLCAKCYEKETGISIYKLCNYPECNSQRKNNGLCFKHNKEEYKQKIYERQKKYERKQYKTNAQYKLAKLLRSRLKDVIKAGKMNKEESTITLTGCSMKKLKKYLESKFQEGMTWENHGEWHIDHIKPCSAFDLENLEEQKKCFHYTNLQPLWAYDNLAKGCKWEKENDDFVLVNIED